MYLAKAFPDSFTIGLQHIDILIFGNWIFG